MVAPGDAEAGKGDAGVVGEPLELTRLPRRDTRQYPALALGEQNRLRAPSRLETLNARVNSKGAVRMLVEP